MAKGEPLRRLLRAQTDGSCDFPDPGRDRLLEQVLDRYGDGVMAVLIYGSYLRGKRDTLLDFYVLLDSYRTMPRRWQAWLAMALPPNVYQIQAGQPPQEVRAKFALLTLDRFERAVRKDFHSYFWARFAQPCGILYCRDEAVHERLIAAFAQSARTFVERVVPRLPDEFDAPRLWSDGLALTYACEFRSEPPGHAETLFSHWPDHYRSMTNELAAAGLGYGPTGDGDRFRNTTTVGARRLSVIGWFVRRLQGKLLSTLRILKAALTFEGALDYLLWKIRRHSGVYIAPTERQRRFPLLFAWPLLWRLWRRGAFR
jgi:hypothetical protein